jgi:hypothetical protein
MPRPTTEWLAEQYRAGRFDLSHAHHHIFSDREHGALASGFNSLAAEAPGGACVNRTALVTRIESQLPLGFPHIFADLVYRILAYHSTAPFYKAPTTSPPPISLSQLDIQRALAWILPDRHLSMATMGTHGRTRTRADHRRLLFQSLATRTVHTPRGPANENARRRYAQRNAFDMGHVKSRLGALDGYASINRDDDGDEMYHDLVDVLHNNVPENFPYGSRRDDLRPLAKGLRADFEFHELALPRGDFADFVRALLALQYGTDRAALEPGDLLYLDEAVASVMATFACDERDVQAAYPTADDLIAWPAFDQGIKQIAQLLDPVYRVLNDVLLNGYANMATVSPHYGVPPELQPQHQTADTQHVLSRGRMTLTTAIVPPLVDWDTLHITMRWRRGATPQPSSDALWTHIRTRALEADTEPQASILAFSGHVRGSSESFVGGVLAAADYDRDDGRELMHSVYVFRLEPSVRYAKLLGQEWQRGPSGDLVFARTTLERFWMDVGEMVVGMELPGGSGEQVVELDALEIWKDGG